MEKGSKGLKASLKDVKRTEDCGPVKIPGAISEERSRAIHLG